MCFSLLFDTARGLSVCHPYVTLLRNTSCNICVIEAGIMRFVKKMRYKFHKRVDLWFSLGGWILCSSLLFRSLSVCILSSLQTGWREQVLESSCFQQHTFNICPVNWLSSCLNGWAVPNTPSHTCTNSSISESLSDLNPSSVPPCRSPPLPFYLCITLWFCNMGSTGSTWTQICLFKHCDEN